jgi:hypothetical protein
MTKAAPIWFSSPSSSVRFVPRRGSRSHFSQPPTHETALARAVLLALPEATMTTHTRSEDSRNSVLRYTYGALLLLAVVALMIYALRFAFPSGTTGIEADPVEMRPAEPAAPR